MVRNFTKKYVCGKCRGKLEILCINPWRNTIKSV
jgi:hypothetical protein